MSKLKITKGKALILKHNWSDTSIYIDGKTLLTLSIYDEATEDNQDHLEVKMEANAELIADAFNTANETDKLPSKIKQERDDLLAKLRIHADIFSQFRKRYELTDNHRGELHSAELNTVELINKIENNE